MILYCDLASDALLTAFSDVYRGIQKLKILVLTVSDRASKGEYEDKSGPAIEEILAGQLNDATIERRIVSDDAVQIAAALEDNLSMDFIITTGGTGIGPRDVTPEVTEEFCERMVPGVGEMLRAESLKQTINASLSRGVAGMRGRTMIVNLPGSVRGASFCAELLVPILSHAIKMVAGEGH